MLSWLPREFKFSIAIVAITIIALLVGFWSVFWSLKSTVVDTVNLIRDECNVTGSLEGGDYKFSGECKREKVRDELGIDIR